MELLAIGQGGWQEPTWVQGRLEESLGKRAVEGC